MVTLRAREFAMLKANQMHSSHRLLRPRRTWSIKRAAADMNNEETKAGQENGATETSTLHWKTCPKKLVLIR